MLDWLAISCDTLIKSDHLTIKLTINKFYKNKNKLEANIEVSV